jgi:hypothetical protein
MESLRLYLDEKAAITSGLPGMRVGIHLRWGRAVRKLVQFAIEAQADIIVIGSRQGPHAKDWVVGSTVETLVSAASFQVLVASPRLRVPEEEHGPLVEPTCTACLQTRTASVGQSWWCDSHVHAAQLAHAMSYKRELPMTATQQHDSEIIPSGIRF